MENGRARLAVQPEFLLGHLNGSFEGFYADIFRFGRVQAQRKQELGAARSFRNSFGFPQSHFQLIRSKAPQLMHLDMFIVPRIQQMLG